MNTAMLALLAITPTDMTARQAAETTTALSMMLPTGDDLTALADQTLDTACGGYAGRADPTLTAIREMTHRPERDDCPVTGDYRRTIALLILQIHCHHTRQETTNA